MTQNVQLNLMVMGARVKHGTVDCVVVGCYKDEKDTFPNLITYDPKTGAIIIDYITRFIVNVTPVV